MLTTLNLKVGSILHDMEQNIDHRVIDNVNIKFTKMDRLIFTNLDRII